MLHEPEFESANSEPDAAETAVKSSRAGKIFRGLLYTGLIAVFGVAVGVNASPRFAETVVSSVPAPVAAAMSSVTGIEMTALDSEGGSCCSTMTRASLMMASEEDGCCSGSDMCPLEKAAMMAASAEASSGCCSSSMTSTELASAETACSGVCPLTGGSEEAVVADAATTTDEEVAVSLSAPQAESSTEEAATPVEVELSEDADTVVETVEISI